MKAHQLSASKVDLALYGCTYWARADVPHPARPCGPSAARGNAVHKASDLHHKMLPQVEMEPDAYALWETLRSWLGTERPYTHSEIAILYDAETDTATACQTGANERDYLDVTATRLPMRLDLVRLADDELYVLDIKTGSKANTEAAPDNVQLATQAVGASRLFGVDRVKVGLVFPMKTKVHEPEWHVLDADALDEHAGKLHRTLKMIPTSEPVRGSHCFRCPIGPAKGFSTDCPAWQNEQAAE